MASARSRGMTPDDLKARTKKFAVDMIQFARSVPRDPNQRPDRVSAHRRSDLGRRSLSSGVSCEVSCGLHQQAVGRNRGSGRVCALARDIGGGGSLRQLEDQTAVAGGRRADAYLREVSRNSQG